MKKGCSKLLAIIMALAAVVPTIAKADGYGEYKKGEERNFYRSVTDSQGTQVMILEDSDTDSKFVKSWLIGSGVKPTEQPYIDLTTTTDVSLFSNRTAYKTIKDELNLNGFEFSKDTTYHNTVEDEDGKPIEGNLTLISVDEIKDIFGVNQDNTITSEFAIKVFSTLKEHQDQARVAEVGAFKGFFTSTVEGTDVYVVEMVKDANDKITSAVLKKVPYATTNDYDYIPVLYLNKEQDCNKKQTEQKYACYSCGEDYTWTTVGSQADTCTLVETVTSKANCVKSPKTGVKEYALEFAVVAGIGLAVLAVVKRKDLFRSI